MNLKISFGKIALGCLLVLLLICIITKPAIYMQATYKGVMVWATCVLPALFPFFFLTTLLSELHFIDKLSFLTKRPLKHFYNVSNNAGFVYLMSMMSGYPVGAKLISELYKNKQISKDECVRIHSFSSTSGPIFVIGTVGSGMLCNTHIGGIVLVVHLLSALINGFLYRNTGKNYDITSNYLQPRNSLDNLLGQTIYQSVISVLIVGGYIALSFMFCEFLAETNILKFLCIPLDKMLTIIGINTQLSECIVLGLTEITRGCLECAPLLASNPKLVVITLSGIISFGGFSVALQSMTYLSKCGISIKMYLLQKFSHSLIAIILASIITLWI